MSSKVWLILTIFCSLSLETFGFAIHQRLRRSAEEDGDDEGVLPEGIKLGSQQNAQSSSENVGKGNARGMQQHHQGQQQLAAALGGKHYLLQQQVSLGQQLAKMGKKTAVQQLADIQKQAVNNGDVKNSKKTDVKDKTHDDHGGGGGGGGAAAGAKGAHGPHEEHDE